MKHYQQTQDGSLWAFEDDGSQDDWIPAGCVRVTEAQAHQIRAAALVREKALAALWVPESVTPFQAKAALLQAGLLGQAEGLVSAAGGVTKLAWDEALEFKRTSPTLLALAEGLGLSPEALDELFRTASRIEA